MLQSVYTVVFYAHIEATTDFLCEPYYPDPKPQTPNPKQTSKLCSTCAQELQQNKTLHPEPKTSNTQA